MISRHVVFDEAVFPIAASPHPTDRLYFLLSEEALVVPPIGTPLLVGSTAPRAAMLELMPILLDSPPPPPGMASIAPCRVAPAVPPGFLPRAVLATRAAPRAAPMTPATPRAALAPLAALRAVPAAPVAPYAASVTPASPA
jgi:hypothetical protein